MQAVRAQVFTLPSAISIDRVWNPNIWIPVGVVALAWGYFQPASLLERIAVVAISYGTGRAGLALAEQALLSFQQMKLKNHQVTHFIQIPYDPNVFEEAFSRLQSQSFYSTFAKKIQANNVQDCKNYLLQFLGIGTCKGEVIEILKIVRENPLISSKQIINLADHTNVIHTQMMQSPAALPLKDVSNDPFPPFTQADDQYFSPKSALETLERFFPKNLTNPGAGMVEILIQGIHNESGVQVAQGHGIFFQCFEGKFRFYESNVFLRPEYRGFYEFSSRQELLSGLRDHFRVWYEDSVRIRFALPSS